MAGVARTVLPRSRIETSRIGLGLAHVHQLDAKTRPTLIDAAFDLGLTHFDTARLYSDGLSERVLGRTLGKRRSACTIALKFGLLPTPVIGSAGPVAKPLRKVRSLSNKLKLVPYPMRSYSAGTMRRSLHASLRAEVDAIGAWFVSPIMEWVDAAVRAEIVIHAALGEAIDRQRRPA